MTPKEIAERFMKWAIRQMEKEATPEHNGIIISYGDSDPIIDDGQQYGEVRGREVPDFVAADNEGWIVLDDR